MLYLRLVLFLDLNFLEVDHPSLVQLHIAVECILV